MKGSGEGGTIMPAASDWRSASTANELMPNSIEISLPSSFFDEIPSMLMTTAIHKITSRPVQCRKMPAWRASRANGG